MKSILKNHLYFALASLMAVAPINGDCNPTIHCAPLPECDFCTPDGSVQQTIVPLIKPIDPAIAKDIQGQNVLVVGGSRGYSKAISERFAAAGCNVIASSRKPQLYQEYGQWDLGNLNYLLAPTALDTAFDQSVRSFFDYTILAANPIPSWVCAPGPIVNPPSPFLLNPNPIHIDILVLTAFEFWSGPLSQASASDLVNNYDHSVVGYHRVIINAVKYMDKNGLILMAGSGDGEAITPFQPAYDMAKRALHKYVQNWNVERELLPNVGRPTNQPAGPGTADVGLPTIVLFEPFYNQVQLTVAKCPGDSCPPPPCFGCPGSPAVCSNTNCVNCLYGATAIYTRSDSPSCMNTFDPIQTEWGAHLGDVTQSMGNYPAYTAELVYNIAINPCPEWRYILTNINAADFGTAACGQTCQIADYNTNKLVNINLTCPPKTAGRAEIRYWTEQILCNFKNGLAPAVPACACNTVGGTTGVDGSKVQQPLVIQAPRNPEVRPIIMNTVKGAKYKKRHKGHGHK